MAEAPGVRDALFDTIDDIEPPPFRTELETVVADASLTPGVLTVRTADVLSPTVNSSETRQRGAAVQLSYEGLKLTRRLARDAPWEDPAEERNHDLDLIIAETLVARGFYHLAQTGVATRAVEIVRRFGRNLTTELQLGERPTEPSLEVDVVALAVLAGADLALTTTPPELVDYAEGYGREIEAVPLPSPEETADFERKLEHYLASIDSAPVGEVDETRLD